jgi:[NiFe] hydrogenase diaphorase moiety small subunit
VTEPTSVTVTVDGVPVTVPEGTTLAEAAAAQGIYVPTLCYHEGHCLGTCRVCVVRVDGHVAAGCSVAVREGADVEVDAPDLAAMRRAVVGLLFAEGNHNCPSCEKSGRCELQGVAYEVGMLASEFPYRYPVRTPDHASQRIWLERDRCILCQRCVEFVRDRDTGRRIFSMSGRGEGARIEVDVELADAMPDDQVAEAVAMCPVGAILRKRVGYDEPIGGRRFDRLPVRERALGEEE